MLNNYEKNLLKMQGQVEELLQLLAGNRMAGIGDSYGRGKNI